MVQYRVTRQSHNILRGLSVPNYALWVEWKTNLHRSHDILDALVVQFQYAVQYVDLVIPERLFSVAMELPTVFRIPSGTTSMK